MPSGAYQFRIEVKLKVLMAKDLNFRFGFPAIEVASGVYAGTPARSLGGSAGNGSRTASSQDESGGFPTVTLQDERTFAALARHDCWQQMAGY
jgi:hypothetical protein